MKVLFVDLWFNSANDRVFQAIVNSGVDVRICLTVPSVSIQSSKLADSYHVLNKKKNNVLWNFLHKWNPEFVFICGISHWSIIFWKVYLYSIITGKKLYTHQDTSSFESSEPAWWKNIALKKLLYRYVYGGFYGIIVPSTKSKNLFLNIGIPNSKILVLPFPLVFEEWSFSESGLQSKASIKEELALSDKNTIISTVARLEWCKALDVLLQAFARIKNLNCVLIICGDGSEKAKLKTLCVQLGITERVRFLGQCSHKQVREIYGISDIFVLPSRREPAGNVVCEAMLNKLPVIVSSAVGYKDDFIIEEISGLSFRVDDVNDLFEKMRRLINDRLFAEKLALNGYEKAKTATDPSAHANAYMRIFQNTIL